MSTLTMSVVTLNRQNSSKTKLKPISPYQPSDPPQFSKTDNLHIKTYRISNSNPSRDII